MAVADRDDEMANLRAVITQLRLFALGWRRRRWHHFAAAKVLHDQAEIVLWQAGRNLIPVGRVGSKRDTRARREVLHRGSRHIVTDDVGKPNGGCFSSQ